MMIIFATTATLAKGGNIIYLKLIKGRRQNSFPLTTNCSQNLTAPSKGISYSVCNLCLHFTKLTGPIAYTLHSNPIPQEMVQMAFCDLSHTFHKQVTNVSQHVFCHPTVSNFDISPILFLMNGTIIMNKKMYWIKILTLLTDICNLSQLLPTYFDASPEFRVSNFSCRSRV